MVDLKIFYLMKPISIFKYTKLRFLQYKLGTIYRLLRGISSIVSFSSLVLNPDKILIVIKEHIQNVETWHRNFSSIFAIFFPFVSGIFAGANLSGDLKDPTESIPKGTLLSILITGTSYIYFAVLSTGCSLREASGKRNFNVKV